MRFLLSTTAFGALAAAAFAANASAETVISTATTTPVTTSATGDLRIANGGTIKPANGVAVTINSSNDVKNEGAIAIQGANNAVGILGNTNLSSDITNTGTITVDEDFTATDTDKDGDLDGPFAQGSGRFGIRVLPGGTFTGNVLNSGTITVEGNQSAGIAIDGALAGNLTNKGKVGVLGNNSVGIRTGAVNGNVVLDSGSAVAAQGQNSVGVLLGGNIGGSLVIQGSVTSTGYRNTTAPADQSKLDSDDLLQGGSAVVVAGNVAGGILLDARPADNSSTDTDEDDDGIADAQETTASITTFGAAPALAIGSSSQDVTVGAVGSTGFGLVVKGNVTAAGVYDGVSATGISIGGAGHSVNITGGASISGKVSATAVKADATAVKILSGATVPTLDVSGTVAATAGGADTAKAQAILIEAGATVNTIRNSGRIDAALAGTGGSTAAIVDKSGTLTLVENSGTISGGTAIDLSANTSGATVRQLAVSSGPAASIIGDIKFGTGNDVLQIQAGSLTGNVDFGGGSDSFELGGTFRGQLANSAGTSVTVGSNGLFDVQTVGAVNLASLTTASGGSIGVTIGDSGSTLYNVAGTANFGQGSKVVVTLQSLGSGTGSYKIVDAGTLVGGSNLTSSVVVLPFLFESSLTASDATGEVTLDIGLKDKDELGINTSEAAIIDAALAAADSDAPIAAIFLQTADSATLRGTLQQLLPEHAGGAFEIATRGTRLSSRILTDPAAPLADLGKLSLWFQQVGWRSTKSIGSTSGYKLSGWGSSMGAETPVGKLGSVGVMLGYQAGRNSRGESDLISNEYEGGVYWRGGVGPLRGFARATAARLDFDETRRLNVTAGSASVDREAVGEWSGTLYSATAGAFYDARFGRFSLRPLVSVEHFKLTEKGHSESGGGDGFDLIVDGRSSSETNANAMLAVGYELLGLDHSGPWIRVELEGGRREHLGGKVGDTTARFADGDPFTLVAEKRTSGWQGAFRVLGGGSGTTIGAEINAEQQQGDTSVGGRISAQIPF
jgi:hypothetical protein